jgi:aminoglycoside phosphotransferase (APT) family kinase protein
MADTTIARKLGEGQESEVFLLNDGRVMKLYKSSSGGKAVKDEILGLEEIGRLGVPSPKVHGYVNVDGKHGYIMDFVPGNSLLRELERAPLSLPALAREFGRIHSAINGMIVDTGVGDIKEGRRRCIQAAKGLPADQKDYALDLLRRLPDGNSVCHGDFNPSNVMLEGGKAVCVDWGGLGKGDPVADVAHTMLILKNGQFPPGASRAQQGLMKAGRNWFARSYLSEYQKHKPVDLGLLSDWELVQAACRLSYGGEGERPALLGFIGRHCQGRKGGKAVLF